MRFATKLPNKVKQWFNILAEFALIDTTGVTLRLMKDPEKADRAGQAVGSTVRLPYPSGLGYDYGNYGRSFLHELRHVTDTKAGITYDLTLDQIEARARMAERLVDEDTMRSLARSLGLHKA